MPVQNIFEKDKSSMSFVCLHMNIINFYANNAHFASIWSNVDHLYDDVPRHWTGEAVTLVGMIRIDDSAYRLDTGFHWSKLNYLSICRFMANSNDLPAKYMNQTDLQVDLLLFSCIVYAYYNNEVWFSVQNIKKTFRIKN